MKTFPVAATLSLTLLVLAAKPARAGTQDMTGIVERVRAAFPRVPQWSTEEAASRLSAESGDRPLLLDVREPEEFAVSHIPGARNVPPDANVEDVLEGIPADRQILVYCSVGYRSSEFAEHIRAAGHAAVANLEGSIFKWANEARPLVSETGVTRQVHGYDAKWSRYLREDLRYLPR
jgi:rhodanese-related sulfurtransferase